MIVSKRDFAARKAKQAAKKAKRIEKGIALGLRKARGSSRTRRQALMAQCLDLGSQYIRLRDSKRTGGLCVFGCGRQIFCWFHFVKQSRSLTVRFDERNIVASCGPCNGKMEYGEGWAWEWYVNQYGFDQMQEVLRLSHETANFSLADLEWIRDGFKSKIKNLAGMTQGRI